MTGRKVTVRPETIVFVFHQIHDMCMGWGLVSGDLHSGWGSFTGLTLGLSPILGLQFDSQTSWAPAANGRQGLCQLTRFQSWGRMGLRTRIWVMTLNTSHLASWYKLISGNAGYPCTQLCAVKVHKPTSGHGWEKKELTLNTRKFEKITSINLI